MDITGSFQCHELSLRAEATMSRIGMFPLTLSGQVGVARCYVDITQEVRFDSYPDRDSRSKLVCQRCGCFHTGNDGHVSSDWAFLAVHRGGIRLRQYFGIEF